MRQAGPDKLFSFELWLVVDAYKQYLTRTFSRTVKAMSHDRNALNGESPAGPGLQVGKEGSVTPA